MRRASWMVLGGMALTGLSAACGFPAFEFEQPGDGGAGVGTQTGTTSGTGLGGTGGVGGAATGTATASGTTTGVGGTGGDGNAGGTGGEPPRPCDLWDLSACDAEEKCSVYDVESGATGCVNAGSRAAWTSCNSDLECVDRTWCDQANRVCKPLCQTGEDCSDGGECIDAPKILGGEAIPGLQVCTANCDPMNPMGICQQSPSPSNCLDTPNNGFDCFRAGNSAVWGSCVTNLDCPIGTTCEWWIVDGGVLCRPWCDSDSQCSLFASCHGHNPTLLYGGVEIGWCTY